MSYKKLLLVAFLAFMMLGLSRPLPARAALSVGAEFGGIFTSNLELNGSTNRTKCSTINDITVDPAFMCGLTTEYYFINKGVLKYNWPTWMENFSVAMDFSYNPIAFGHQTANFICGDPNWGSAGLPEFKGHVITLSFLFKYRFPLLKQPDYPDGRLFLYFGVGPGLSINYLEANNTIINNTTAIGHGNSTAATLVAETGLSLFIVKDVSIDLFCRYRYLTPNYEFNIAEHGEPLYVSFTNNSYNGGLRIAYHF
jgi:hypothetical protein